MPGVWAFELIEIWYGNSLWNPTAAPAISTDYENFYGRKTYAENCEGGYYAVRLGVVEHLQRIRRQASALVVREAMPEYAVPVAPTSTKATMNPVTRIFLMSIQFAQS